MFTDGNAATLTYNLLMSEIAAMTVLERLFHVGLIDSWETAVKAENRREMLELLTRVELADQAEWIVDTVLRRQA